MYRDEVHLPTSGLLDNILPQNSNPPLCICICVLTYHFNGHIPCHTSVSWFPAW